MSFNFNVSTNIDITKKILKFISLLKLLKFRSFCNVNQHYLIIVTPPPPPPPPPPSSPFSPFFWGGGKGTGGRGRGGRGGDGQGTIAPPPPERRGGDEVPPPSPSGFYKKLFYPGSFINIFIFSLKIFKSSKSV